jgi:ABC-type protease/lipase transport system fused ATPase/permease subunit
MTVVGSKGLALSGGQKQRVVGSMAMPNAKTTFS